MPFVFKVTADSKSNIIGACFKEMVKSEENEIEKICLLTQNGSLLQLCSEQQFYKQKQSCLPKVKLQRRKTAFNFIFF